MPQSGRPAGRPPGRQVGRAPAGRPGSRPGARPRPRGRTGPEAVASRTQARSSRFTGRAMVLVLVLSVLAISYASPPTAYFQQHSQIERLRSQIAASETSIGRLEDEKARWQDPADGKEQARAGFGSLIPGQTSYVVIGADGKPLAAESTLSDPRTAKT